MSNIRRIKKADLYRLEPLLRTSFGKGFEFQDELNYFGVMPHSSWFYVEGDLQPKGFIRCFNLHDTLYTVELFVIPSPHRSEAMLALIKHFQKHNRLESDTQVRFEVGESHSALQRLLAGLFPVSRVERFLYLQKKLASFEKQLERSSFTQRDLSEVQKILKVLKQYSLEDLAALHADEKLHVQFEADAVVAALHLEPAAQGGAEIITLATNPRQLRKGYATELLKTSFKWASLRFRMMNLKVNERNRGAINLYKKLGFESVPENASQWWYVPINAR